MNCTNWNRCPIKPYSWVNDLFIASQINLHYLRVQRRWLTPFAAILSPSSLMKIGDWWINRNLFLGPTLPATTAIAATPPKCTSFVVPTPGNCPNFVRAPTSDILYMYIPGPPPPGEVYPGNFRRRSPVKGWPALLHSHRERSSRASLQPTLRWTSLICTSPTGVNRVPGGWRRPGREATAETIHIILL